MAYRKLDNIWFDDSTRKLYRNIGQTFEELSPTIAQDLSSYVQFDDLDTDDLLVSATIGGSPLATEADLPTVIPPLFILPSSIVAGNYIIPGFGRYENADADFIHVGIDNTKHAEYKVPFSGTIRVYFKLALAIDSVAGTAYARVYKNGSAVGTNRSSSSTAYTKYYDDIAVSSGNLIQLYMDCSGTSIKGAVQSFALCWNQYGELYL